MVTVLAGFTALPESVAQPLPAAPKWQRFELTFKSGRSYANPLRDAEVRVLFVSPLGETNRVYGFWDGGKTWRVRYQPAFPGRWKYYTMCSDTANSGLHEQTGEFLCTAPKGDQRFSTHGPVQVARDNQHFEHADRTPFLWLGDAAWNAAAQSTLPDWNDYVITRSEQKFNVVQWKLPRAVFTGRQRIGINLELVRQIESKIEAANRAGLLNAIAPLWEIGANAGDTLPEDQAIALLRYCVARWDADHVAWIVAFEADSTGAQAARWQRIGRAVFNPVAHAPVVLLPGEATWVLDNFREDRWVNAFGLQTSQVTGEDSLPWLLNGPLSLERRKSPVKPLIALAPATETANSLLATSGLSRSLLWWNLLLNTPAGVSSSAQDVSEWATVSKAQPDSQPWHQALSLPGASAMAALNDCFASKDFWQLSPVKQAILSPPDSPASRNHLVAAATEDRNLVLAYVPDAPTVKLAARALPAKANAYWLNPRTAAVGAAKVVNSSDAYEFPTPGPGDWLLLILARK